MSTAAHPRDEYRAAMIAGGATPESADYRLARVPAGDIPCPHADGLWCPVCKAPPGLRLGLLARLDPVTARDVELCHLMTPTGGSW